MLGSETTKQMFADFLTSDFNTVEEATTSFNNILGYVADNSLKKVKCRTKRKNNFDFTYECLTLKKDFKLCVNDFKKDKLNHDKIIEKKLMQEKNLRKKII